MKGRINHETAVLVPWSKEEDNVLLQVVLDSMKEGVKLADTFEIAADVIGRTNKACQQRWTKKLYPKHKKVYLKLKEEGRNKNTEETFKEKRVGTALPKEVVLVPSTHATPVDAVEQIITSGAFHPLSEYVSYLEQKNSNLQSELAQLTQQHKKLLQQMLTQK